MPSSELADQRCGVEVEHDELLLLMQLIAAAGAQSTSARKKSREHRFPAFVGIRGASKKGPGFSSGPLRFLELPVAVLELLA